MNQYRCDKVRTCGSCHHSVFEPEGMFCNHHEPYFKTRLDSWTREPPVWCPLPFHTDIQSERDKYEKILTGIEELFIDSEEDTFQCRDCNSIMRSHMIELRQAGEP
jgi:hypothetical protein